LNVPDNLILLLARYVGLHPLISIIVIVFKAKCILGLCSSFY
jgi:hypothetical protein